VAAYRRLVLDPSQAPPATVGVMHALRRTLRWHETRLARRSSFERAGWIVLSSFVLGASFVACGEDASRSSGAADDAGTSSEQPGNEPPYDAPPHTLPDGGQASSSDQPRFVQYLRAQPYERLVLEVDSVMGMAPYPEVERRLIERFAPLLDKPAGITVVHDDTLQPRGSEHAWSDEALRELAKATFDDAQAANTITMHVMVVDGHSARDGDGSRILGLAWGHLHMVLFKETIEASCRRQGLFGLLADTACREAELGIWTHELGHVLGLVDNGLPMVEPHRSVDHGRHDMDRDCIMYWAYNGTPLVDRIITLSQTNGSPSLNFCEHCRADMAAVQ
jgi:hypothetical protein